MNIVTKVNEWQKIRASLKDKSIGFVPTMGHLHQGHVSLCERAKNENDLVVVSIFVNPMQFNQTQDFDKYPRTLLEDQKLLEAAHVDYLFVPEAEEIYQDQFEIQVAETKISQILEGEFRPGHFTGMLTVVLKLLNIVSPTRAYFGEKDYQQLLLIQKMARALFLPIEIIACSTIRADDNLALSSRNSRLNEAQRQKAVQFAEALQSNLSPTEIKTLLETQGFKVDYIADAWGRRLGAVWLDEVRLIDNREV
jgi:pantoate--beta-alanine ligase